MKSTLDYLYSLHKFGIKFGLRNIRTLLRFVDNPHRSFRTIHIAGTNGKGSTSSMIAAILTAAGYKVGLYTSPHLVRFNERIRINGKMISDGDIVRYTKLLKPEIQRCKATFFEATTAMAFKYFADQNVDVAVIETGLGGRLDSTNVVKPVVSVITSIGKDHMEQLGDTLALIAGEKAGIIKRKVPIVIGDIRGVSRTVIVKKAEGKRSPIIDSSKIQLPGNLALGLKGKHQISNARTALAAVNIACKYFVVGDKAIRLGLERTAHYTGLRARFEIVSGTPDILFDVAHNPDGMKTLVSELKNLSYNRFVVIFAVMKDKDYRAILTVLTSLNPTLISTQPNIDRALSVEQLFDISRSLKIKVVKADTIDKAITIGKKTAGQKGLLVITGSHYIVGETLEFLKV